MKNGCDYYKASGSNSTVNCPSCVHWLPLAGRCSIEDKVLSGKTALVHEAVSVPRARGVSRVFH